MDDKDKDKDAKDELCGNCFALSFQGIFKSISNSFSTLNNILSSENSWLKKSSKDKYGSEILCESIREPNIESDLQSVS